jgi:hypothetical protein
MDNAAPSVQSSWASLNPATWLDAWRTGRWAPTSLIQPILPGWNFGPSLTVNENNSTAPLTEAAIVQQQSYGRQLGTLIDAVQALIEHPNDSQEERITTFLEMAEEIAGIKRRTSRFSADRIRSELAVLKHTSPAQYNRLVRELVREPTGAPE